MGKIKKIFGSICFVLSLCMFLGVGANAATDEDAYTYNETPADAVTVTVTLSSDGMPLIANNGEQTLLSNVEVTVPYFDLKDFGLEKYYRYGTDENGQYDISKGVVERPTLLHLFIMMIADYYLEEGETLMGNSSKTISNFLGETAYEVKNQAALQLANQPPRSLFMTFFWGHDCNLNYYVNHDYPWDSEGWGATCDYITLEDGDVIDIAMFTNWDFINEPDRGFAFFSKANYEIQTGSEFAIDKVYRVIGGTTGGTAFGTTVVEDTFDYYDYFVLDASGNLETYINDATKDQAKVELGTFDTPGTYYIYAVDNDGGVKDNGTSEASCAPAVATLVVKDVVEQPDDDKEDSEPKEEPDEDKLKAEEEEAKKKTEEEAKKKVEEEAKKKAEEEAKQKAEEEAKKKAEEEAKQKAEEETRKKLEQIVAAKKIVTDTSITSFKAAAYKSTGVKLSWSKNNKVDGYEIYRSTKANNGYSKIKTITKNSTKTYTLKKGLKKSTTYYYRIRGYKVIEDEKVYTPYTRIIVNLNKTKAVQAISLSGLKAKVSKGKVVLTWNGAHESMYKLKGFKVSQSTKAKSGYKNIATVSKAKATIKKGLKKNKTYYFKVQGYVKVGKKTIYTKAMRIKVKAK